MKNIKFQNQLITILITFILILGCEGEMEEGGVQISDKLTKNLCPVAKGDNYTVQNGKSLEIDFNKGVLSNDEDPGGGAMSASLVIQPQKGTLTLNRDGSFTYKHDGSSDGEDKFVYVASNSTCDNTSEPELPSMAQVIITIIKDAEENITTENIYVSGSYWNSLDDHGACYWTDKNNDGIIQYSAGSAIEGRPQYTPERGSEGQRLLSNRSNDLNDNEVYIDRDIMVLANPEIAKLPAWVIALVAAGGLAAALSTAAGLLLVISSSISHDLLKKTFKPNISERQELFYARCAAAVAIFIAGLFGIYPPAFVAQVVAFAFGLAASTFFPALFMGIFSKRLNKEGAIAGMVSGLIFTLTYIIYFKFLYTEFNSADYWFLSISPEGIGFVGMIINFIVAISISSITNPPPKEVIEMVEVIREP